MRTFGTYDINDCIIVEDIFTILLILVVLHSVVNPILKGRCNGTTAIVLFVIYET